MWQYAFKIILSAIILTSVSELVKRSSFLAALLASLPITSVFAFIWIYLDSQDVQKIAEMSQSIFWLVLPSLVLFLVLPPLLRMGFGFWLSLSAACVITVIAYLGMVKFLEMLRIHI
ncbi:MAG: DUF3147 family protein [Thiotrichaceae bacterium]|nr:DUF3147 family protein [Thiotrichaceae bacterium]